MAGRKKISEESKLMIGQRMEQAARQAGFKSGTEVAEAMQVSQATVSRWWRGAFLPEREEMVRYAELMGCEPAWLDRGKDIDDLVADKIFQIVAMIQSGKAGSEAFDASTQDPDKLSSRERRQVDVGTPALRRHINQQASAPWDSLPAKDQRQLVDRLLAETQHLAEE